MACVLPSCIFVFTVSCAIVVVLLFCCHYLYLAALHSNLESEE